MEVVNVTIVLLAIRTRHQHLDVLADYLIGLVLEQFFASGTEHQHAPARVNQDNAVDRGFHDSTQPSCFRALDAGFGFIGQRF
jgi:hypothetical protein